MTQPDPLSPYYYHHNFLCLMDLVSERDWDLLNHAERHWITTFQQLSFKAQCLLIRLLMRRHDWFVAEKLVYHELGDLSPLLDELATQGYVRLTHQAATEVVLNLLTKPQMAHAYPQADVPKSASKAQWQVAIQATYGDTLTSPTMLIECLQPELLSVFLLLYFGNSRQDLSQFVVADLGIQTFESYALRQSERLFQCREHIDHWLHLSALNEHYWQAKKAKQPDIILALTDQLPARYAWPPLERKRQRLVNRIAREHERHANLDSAQMLYQTTTQPPSSERQARIAIKQDDIDLASTLIGTMLRTPHDEDERDIACRLAKQKKIQQQIGPHEWPATPNSEIHTEHLALPLRDRVEWEVADYYRAQGWTVWYSENCLLNALFGLFFWDILFMPVQGAFLNPFQRGPRDLYSEEFCAARQPAIDDRLSDIDNARALIKQHYAEKHGITNDWVNWGVIEWPLLDAALRALSTHQLKACFERILFDRRHNRSGQPDLFMCRADDYQWVEVKGPGDTLQHHQKRWLHFFNHHAINAKVIYVQRCPQ